MNKHPPEVGAPCGISGYPNVVSNLNESVLKIHSPHDAERMAFDGPKNLLTGAIDCLQRKVHVRILPAHLHYLALTFNDAVAIEGSRKTVVAEAR